MRQTRASVRHVAAILLPKGNDHLLQQAEAAIDVLRLTLRAPLTLSLRETLTSREVDEVQLRHGAPVVVILRGREEPALDVHCEDGVAAAAALVELVLCNRPVCDSLEEQRECILLPGDDRFAETAHVNALDGSLVIFRRGCCSGRQRDGLVADGEVRGVCFRCKQVVYELVVDFAEAHAHGDVRTHLRAEAAEQVVYCAWHEPS